MNFFEFIAEEVREYLAALGFRTIEEAIGHVEMLDTRKAIEHWKAQGLDLSPILAVPVNKYDQTFLNSRAQDHGLDRALDNQLIADAAPALDGGASVKLQYEIKNTNRTVGTMLGSELTRRWGGDGLPDGTIDVTFRGSAGQSFGAFVPRGVTLRLEGDANDYFGKGLSGGTLVLRPPRAATFVAEENIIAGNVILYGATAGTVFIRGVVGERFCVRNSGATAVVEGVGDHACEYMTGGRAVILGPTGPQLRGRHVRRVRVRLGPGPLAVPAVQHRDGRPRRARRRRRRLVARHRHHAHGGDRFAGRRTHPVQVVAQRRFVHQDLPEGLQTRARSPTRRDRTRCRRRRSSDGGRSWVRRTAS